MFGEMPFRLSRTNAYARERVQWFAWIRYAIIAVTDRDLPALQWTYVGDECSRASSAKNKGTAHNISEIFHTEDLTDFLHSFCDIDFLNGIPHRNPDILLKPLSQA